MLGYDISWAAFNIVEVMSQTKVRRTKNPKKKKLSKKIPLIIVIF